MKFLIYPIALAILSLIIKSLQTLKKKGFETTSSILKFNFLLIIPAVLAGGFTMSRFYTSPINAKFEKSNGASDSETVITDKITGNHFALPCYYSEVEFGKHFDVVTSGFGDGLQVYDSKGTRMTGIIPVLFRNPFLSFGVVFIIIAGLGNYIWIRKVVHRKPAASKPQNQETQPENITDTAMKENESIQYIDLGLPSGTLWADRNAGAEDVYKLGTPCDKASAPGKLPTYDQCAELINVCDFSSCLVPDENDIMRNFIKAEGPNKNAIFFPCVRPDAEESEIGAYCWCADDSDEYSYFMLLQQRLLGLLDFAEISNLTIGMTLKSGKLMVRNIK